MKKHIFLLLFLCICGIETITAQTNDLLEKSISLEQLKQALVTDESWISYPKYSDREAWNKLILPEVRENIIKAGEKALSYQWKPDLATDYLAFKRKGEIRTGRANQMNLITLALAELVEGKGRFIDQIINGAWFLCEVTWVHSAHAFFQKDKSGLPDPKEPTVELVVADIGAELAWIDYFFHEEFDKISLLISRRIKDTVFERLIDPYYARNDYWWMGFQGQQVNNWNVWINYNVLQSVLLLEKNPDKRANDVYKLMRSVDNYINGQHVDGTCEEGPTYFGHAGANLLKFLDLLKRATGNKVDIFNEDKIKNAGRYIYRVHINDKYFVNFSDAGVTCFVNPGAVYHYGKSIGDNVLTGFASDFARNNNWIQTLHRGSLFSRVLDDVLMSKEILAGKGMQIEDKSYYFTDGQLAVVRDCKETDKGFYFAAHGSNNGVSHNHNDVGSCMLYYNGEPVLIDVGVGTYTKKTFSSERYTIWTMQSGYHNLPTINGTDQHEGKDFHATDVSFKDQGRNVTFTADIAKAYPKEANVDTWIRTYKLKRGKEFIISDAWKLNQTKGETVLNLMTSCQTEVGNGWILLKHKDFTLKLTFDSRLASAKVEDVEIKDKKIKSSWKDGVRRIRLTLKQPKLNGKSDITIRSL